MRLGVVFPQTEIGPDPAVVKDYAQAAEALGYTHQHQFHEPFVLFGYLSGLTQTLELVTGIVILPQRQTALAAKQAAEVDVLSGGRLRLGVGVGWNSVEYDSLNEDFH